MWCAWNIGGIVGHIFPKDNLKAFTVKLLINKSANEKDPPGRTLSAQRNEHLSPDRGLQSASCVHLKTETRGLKSALRCALKKINRTCGRYSRRSG
jgi:hypothetical protein